METPLLIKGLYKKPFRYDRNGQNIFDAKNNHFADIRGWSRIMKFVDKNALTDNVMPVKIQDTVGEYVTKLLNDNYLDNCPKEKMDALIANIDALGITGTTLEEYLNPHLQYENQIQALQSELTKLREENERLYTEIQQLKEDVTLQSELKEGIHSQAQSRISELEKEKKELTALALDYRNQIEHRK